MKATFLAVGLLAVSQQVVAVVDSFTPADFDWNSQVGRYGVAMQNMTTTRAPTKEMVVFAANVHNITELDLARAQLLGIELSVSAILRGVGWATGLGGVVSTALGCYEVIAAAYGGLQSTAISKASCIIGAASGLISLGGSGVAFYLAQRADWAAARVTTIAHSAPLLPDPSSTFGQSFAESIEMHGFRGLGRREDHPWKRDLQGRGLSNEEEWDQYFHNHVTAAMIRNANFGHSEFLGYANDKHQLSKRDGVHALVPRFKFEHPRDGHVVLSTKFTNTTSHITIEPFIEGNPNIHKRWQEQYRKEVIEDGRLLEGRFDHEAAIADPAWQDITVDENAMFQMAEDSLHCTLGANVDDGWSLDQVLDVQMYDNTNRATFGYATLGVFQDSAPENDLSDTMPQPPITGGC